MSSVIYKKCNKCGEHKPLTAYSKQSRIADGHMGICKSCMKQYYEKNKATILERKKNRRATEAGKDDERRQ